MRPGNTGAHQKRASRPMVTTTCPTAAMASVATVEYPITANEVGYWPHHDRPPYPTVATGIADMVDL
jgi:hypothetical protein